MITESYSLYDYICSYVYKGLLDVPLVYFKAGKYLLNVCAIRGKVEGKAFLRRQGKSKPLLQH